MIRRHLYKSDIQAVELSEKEQVLRLCLKNYVDQTTEDIQEQIFQIVSHLIED